MPFLKRASGFLVAFLAGAIGLLWLIGSVSWVVILWDDLHRPLSGARHGSLAMFVVASAPAVVSAPVIAIFALKTVRWARKRLDPGSPVWGSLFGLGFGALVFALVAVGLRGIVVH